MSRLWSRPLIFPVDSFKIFAQNRVHLLLRTFQLVFVKTQMSLVKGSFALVPKIKKKCEVGSKLGVGTAPRVEPIHTRRACAVPMFPELEEPVLAESVEEEEDPDRWKDEFGRTWLRSELFSWRWYLLGIGLDVDIIWEEPSWGATWGEAASSVLRDVCGAGECVFLDYPLTQRLRSSRSVRLSRGVSLWRPLEEFPVLGVYALFVPSPTFSCCPPRYADGGATGGSAVGVPVVCSCAAGGATVGGSAAAREPGSTTGGGAHSPTQWAFPGNTPPAQGGKQILGKVDVPVITQAKFQQFFETVEVPLLQFLDRSLDIPVVPQ